MARFQPHWALQAFAVLCAVPLGLLLASGLQAQSAPDRSIPPVVIQDAAIPNGAIPDAAPPPAEAAQTEPDAAALLPEVPAASLPVAADDPSIDQPAPSLQTEILAVVEELAANKRGLGYDLSSFYTEPLTYGASTLTGKGSPSTMCVGAVTEIMVRAIARWADQNPDVDVYGQLPASKWQSGTLQSLRPWLFVWKLEKKIPAYNRSYGSGTHDALILFGMGSGVKFQDAAPGDFVNFSRKNGSGHAAVFLNFLKADFETTDTFGPDVLGFRYFSAQESGEPGLDYRYAYFDGYCPAKKPPPIRRDCSIIHSDDAAMFSMARLYAPSHWRTSDTRHFLEQVFEHGRSFEDIDAERFDGEPKTLGNRTLQQLSPYITALEAAPAVNFSGETTD